MSAVARLLIVAALVAVGCSALVLQATRQQLGLTDSVDGSGALGLALLLAAVVTLCTRRAEQ